MDTFQLVSAYKPQGDQPKAIAKLVEGIQQGKNIKRCLEQQEQEKRLRFQTSFNK